MRVCVQVVGRACVHSRAGCVGVRACVPSAITLRMQPIVLISFCLPPLSPTCGNNFYLVLSCRYVVLTTSSGILDHEEARRKHTGGKILGFFY